jgi:hypothetical protein
LHYTPGFIQDLFICSLQAHGLIQGLFICTMQTPGLGCSKYWIKLSTG